jgi:tRNA splicing endonuclease
MQSITVVQSRGKSMKKVFVALFLSLALSACNSGNTPSSSSPAKSVENMMSLLEKGEVQAANKFLDKKMQDREFATNAAKGLSKDGIKTIKFEEMNVKGDIGEVGTRFETKSGIKAYLVYSMLRENGQWVVTDMRNQGDIDKQIEENKKWRETFNSMANGGKHR